MAIRCLGLLAVFEQCRGQTEAVANQRWDCSQLDDSEVIVRPNDLAKALATS